MIVLGRYQPKARLKQLLTSDLNTLGYGGDVGQREGFLIRKANNETTQNKSMHIMQLLLIGDNSG